MNEFIGEFRGWIDRPINDHAYPDVMSMYQRVAEHKIECVRAYCVREGLRRGVVELTFGFSFADAPRVIVRLNTCLDVRQYGNNHTTARPFVAPKCHGGSVDGAADLVADPFATWPLLPWKEHAIIDPKAGHNDNRPEHINAYFEFFKDQIDRKSLLLRTGGAK